MLDSWLRPSQANTLDPDVAAALAHAAAAIARLDQALVAHPLLPAFLYRARLEAVRRQAAVDGAAIDPWHLAAVLEGLRLRMDHALRIVDRGAIFAAARHALELHQWLVAPDFDQEGAIQRAEAALGAGQGTTLLAAATGLHAWLAAADPGDGGGRAAGRAAMVRFWTGHRLLRAPIPLTGAAALRPDTPWAIDAWVPAFLHALAAEADDGLQLLIDLERVWFAARSSLARRRRHSRAPAAVDILAAAPLVSATSLAAGLGMAVKNAAALLADFCDHGIAVQVSHRAKRRLFGLAGLAPLREATTAPRRPEPGRGRGRPPLATEEPMTAPALPPVMPLTPLERRALDFSDLTVWMAHMDQTIRHARHTLSAMRTQTWQPEPPPTPVATTPDAVTDHGDGE
jgi:hypothetical protein